MPASMMPQYDIIFIACVQKYPNFDSIIPFSNGVQIFVEAWLALSRRNAGANESDAKCRSLSC